MFMVFDENININEVSKLIKQNGINRIDLFPVTSNWSIIDKVESIVGSSNLPVYLINSAGLINDEVDKIREKVSKWSADFGDYKVGNKSLKEWFLTPGNEVSTWWFSLVSEKNTMKTNTFLWTAQLQAIEKQLRSRDYAICYISIGNGRIRNAVKRLCDKRSIRIKLLNSMDTRSHSCKELFNKYFNRCGILEDVAKALILLVSYTIKGYQAKKIMGSKTNRNRKKDSVLFVTYFPAVDQEAAKKGLFRNKYAIPLQDKLFEMKKSVTWLLMPVPLSSYSNALKLGRNFASNGEIVYFMQEFLSIRLALYCLFVWIVQLIKYLIITKQITPEVLTENLAISESNMFLYPLWRQSFVGAVGMQGIVYFELYKKIFGFFTEATHCIYYAEMHAWEKALNMATHLKNKKIKTIGFQHTSILRNNFRYSYSYKEINDRVNGTALPLPDIFACNGDIPFQEMSKLKYPNLVKVEAIRQLYLSDKVTRNYSEKSEPILLVAGSMNKKETISMILLIHAAFPKKQKFKIWMNGHPATPINYLLNLLNIDIEECGYEIKDEPIEEVLEQATVVVVGDSTVAIEALMFNCHVILPVFSDNMFLSPLYGFEKYYTKVHNPVKLKCVVETLLSRSNDHAFFQSAREFVSSYWYLDESLKGWEKLLS